MTVTLEHTTMSAAEFLAWEQRQPVRHEYVGGEVFARAGGSMRHNSLCGRLIIALSALTERCSLMTSDQRIGFVSGDRYVYPDLSVVCGRPETPEHANDVLLNPVLIVEVLSRSTEAYDRGGKWLAYQSIASLADYVLVSQSEMRVEQYRRTPDGWLYQTAGPGQTVLLHGVEVSVDALYRGAFDLPGDDVVDITRP